MDSDYSSEFAPSPAAKGKKAPAVAKAKATAASKKKTPLAPRKNKNNVESADEEGDVVVVTPDQDDDVYMEPATGSSKPKVNAKSKSATETYQKLTQLEHILKRPDTYIGSVEMQKGLRWVYDKVNKRMAEKEINFVPGFYKIFDEILVNAADNKVRANVRINAASSADDDFVVPTYTGARSSHVLHQNRNRSRGRLSQHREQRQGNSDRSP